MEKVKRVFFALDIPHAASVVSRSARVIVESAASCSAPNATAGQGGAGFLTGAQMIQAYPLYWPAGRIRTDRAKRDRSRFDTKMKLSREQLRDNLLRMAAGGIIISSNLPLKSTGEPYADYDEPDDPGVAVYFTLKQKQLCFACDRYKTVLANTRAVGLTIAALRGIERWGTGDMMERSFQGFLALPEPDSWKDVLGLNGAATLETVDAAFKLRAKSAHPDLGGSTAAMARLNRAREEAWAAIEQKA